MRMQQIMAFETDLLEYEDLFDGNPTIEAKVARLKDEARHELASLEALGGAIEAIGHMKSRLVESNTLRLNKIASNETTVVGVNKFTTGEPSPLTAGDGGIMTVDPAVEQDQVNRLNTWRSARDDASVAAALRSLRAAARAGENIMPASIAAAKAGVTTGEWAAQMRLIYGEYRGPTGVAHGVSNQSEGLDEIRDAVDLVSQKLGRRLGFLMGKPGLDGHSNGAEQIAARARDCGMKIAYDGIRLTPEQLIASVQEHKPHVIGLSILSGSHIPLVEDMMKRLQLAQLDNNPVVVGGIIPQEDMIRLTAMGVAKIYTPKDFELNAIMMDIVSLADPTDLAAE
jgi:(2R)-ethylmalonyl-CoA mutase